MFNKGLEIGRRVLREIVLVLAPKLLHDPPESARQHFASLSEFSSLQELIPSCVIATRGISLSLARLQLEQQAVSIKIGSNR